MAKTDSEKIDVRKEVMRGIVDLIRHKPFYGHILQQLSKVYGDEYVGSRSSPITTMGVGKGKDEITIKLYICEKFVRSLWEEAKDNDEAWNFLVGILEHETCHCCFQHLSLEFTDKIRGNVAMDLVVNCCINRSQLPKSAVTVDLYGFEPHKSAMWYYVNLKDNKEYKKQLDNGDFGVNGIMSKYIGSHNMWDEAKKDPVLKDIIKDIVAKSKDLCNNEYGNIPSNVISEIDGLLKRKKAIVPWNKVLRMFTSSAMESNLDYTMKRTSRRFGTRPGTKKEDILNLAIGIDSSGSVSDEMLEVFCNEIKWIWNNGALVTVYECDCAIHAVYKFKGKFTGKITGRGGTDLEPVLKETEGKYDALIYFTDFYAPVIQHRYRIPILWVLKTEMNRSDFPYKWGKFVKIDNGIAEKA